MTISESLLAKLNEFGFNDDIKTTMIVETDDWHLTLDTDRSDRLSCSVVELDLCRRNDDPAGRTVHIWAERIAASVSGLRENLKLVEVDTEEKIALLRSATPSRKGAVVSYYEVRLQGVHRANVQRFEIDSKAGTPRIAVSFPLTHEVLAKLVDDIAG